uniref:Attachment protein n=1 Tax=avian metapneumovirus TaxID=38525 RepID=G5DFE5_9MONO|nr:attachment protein [Avian metapneumovirus]
MGSELYAIEGVSSSEIVLKQVLRRSKKILLGLVLSALGLTLTSTVVISICISVEQVKLQQCVDTYWAENGSLHPGQSTENTSTRDKTTTKDPRRLQATGAGKFESCGYVQVVDGDMHDHSYAVLGGVDCLGLLALCESGPICQGDTWSEGGNFCRCIFSSHGVSCCKKPKSKTTTAQRNSKPANSKSTPPAHPDRASKEHNPSQGEQPRRGPTSSKTTIAGTPSTEDTSKPMISKPKLTIRPPKRGPSSSTKAASSTPSHKTNTRGTSKTTDQRPRTGPTPERPRQTHSTETPPPTTPIHKGWAPTPKPTTDLKVNPREGGTSPTAIQKNPTTQSNLVDCTLSDSDAPQRICYQVGTYNPSQLGTCNIEVPKCSTYGYACMATLYDTPFNCWRRTKRCICDSGGELIEWCCTSQ